MGLRGQFRAVSVVAAAILLSLVGCGKRFERPPVEVLHRESILGAGNIIQIKSTTKEELTDIEVTIKTRNREVRHTELRLGAIPEAIQAYERALELDPEHEDARFNRDLLMQQEPQESPSQGGEQGGDPEQSPSEDGQNDSQADSEESQEGADPQNAEASESEDSQSEQVAESQLEQAPVEESPLPTPGELEEWASEQAAEQWLRRIPEDPGGLLRRKFLYQYQRLGIDQDGNYVWPGDEEQPW